MMATVHMKDVRVWVMMLVLSSLLVYKYWNDVKIIWITPSINDVKSDACFDCQ